MGIGNIIARLFRKPVEPARIGEAEITRAIQAVRASVTPNEQPKPPVVEKSQPPKEQDDKRNLAPTNDIGHSGYPSTKARYSIASYGHRREDAIDDSYHDITLNTMRSVAFGRELVSLVNAKCGGKAGRSTWYVIKRSAIKENNAAIDLWKVVVSSANAGGQKRDWQLELLDNHSAFGRSRVALGMFKTKQEAENFYKFCQSYLVRFLFLMTDEALTTLAKEVPYFADWKTAGGLIDFGGDINAQLCSLCKLAKTKVCYISEKIRSIDAARTHCTIQKGCSVEEEI